MILSTIGEIANDEWLKTPEIRKDMNIILDEFVVMPDHFHAIIIIGENRYNQCKRNYNDTQCRDAMHRVSTNPAPTSTTNPTTASTTNPTTASITNPAPTSTTNPAPTSTTNPAPTSTTNPTTASAPTSTTNPTSTSASVNKNSFGPQSKNLASIIRGFKSAVTIRARIMDPGFAWQSKYYDHIIRTHIELIRIRNYIINNPSKWGKM